MVGTALRLQFPRYLVWCTAGYYSPHPGNVISDCRNKHDSPWQSFMASSTTRKCLTCSAASCKPAANAEFTTPPYWLVATQGAIDWKVALAGRALDCSGWLTMLQTANYLERTAKSDDIVCFPRLTLGPAPIKHYIKKNNNHFPTCIIIP